MTAHHPPPKAPRRDLEGYVLGVSCLADQLCGAGKN
jgi:hypothetical protein